MSILYITITEHSENGDIIDYKVNEIFKDEIEMVKWFAYSESRYNKETKDLSSEEIDDYSS